MTTEQTQIDALSGVTFGAAPIGNLFKEVSDEAAYDTLQAAWDAGVRNFDVAPHYGLGLAEIRLGNFLADKPRESFNISTKVGRILRPNSNFSGGLDLHNGFAVPDDLVRVPGFTPEGVIESLNDSLERLNLDYVDVLYLHDPDEYGLEESLTGGLNGLVALRDQGVVREVGLGSKSVEAHIQAVSRYELDLIMLAGRYTLLDQEAAESLLGLCEAKSVDIVNVGIFNSGILARNLPQPNLKFEYDEAPLEVIERAERISSICQQHGVDLPTAAIHFAMQPAVVRSIALAASKPGNITESLNRVTEHIPMQLWRDLETEGIYLR
ncbi:MAG: aldo/keto reductase [Aurantimicrobium sp.]|uniref:aldo/keto reductase n=1 Tax=Aurantimicrobium sp. TaxID=1930784 RepID=UPI002FC77433